MRALGPERNRDKSKSDVAAGVDGVTWEMYADGSQDRLCDLCDGLHGVGCRKVRNRTLRDFRPIIFTCEQDMGPSEW